MRMKTYVIEPFSIIKNAISRMPPRVEEHDGCVDVIDVPTSYLHLTRAALLAIRDPTEPSSLK